MPVTRRDPDAGFTMIATVLAMAAIMLLAVVAVAAVRGDTHLTQRDLEGKQAYEAAKAGIDEYAYQLNANSSYWAECAKPSGVNQEGSTAKRRPVPGNTGAEYAIELIPATGHSTCDPSSIATASETMLEHGEALSGSFRIRSNGFAGKAKSAIVATFKPPSFLDYVYFTQRETSDPVTYIKDAADTTKALEAVTAQCSKTWEEGRYDRSFEFQDNSRHTVREKCNTINFISADSINGSLRTNDAIAICGTPTFGRSASDMIEVGAKIPGEHPGWFSNCSSWSDEPDFVGEYESGVPNLEPPETNAELKSIVEPAFDFRGQVRICLSGTTMTVGSGSSCTGEYSGGIPKNGVVYVENGSGACTGTYSPFDLEYATSSECGNAFVKDTSSSGSYSGRLTIAAEGDIIINGNLISTGSGMLGLIANNFVRIYHPVELKHPQECVRYSSSWYSGKECVEYRENLEVTEGCRGNASGSLKNPTIDAAILAINHSFIVDNYDCGSSLGTLTVEGAIAQDYRGPVGTGGSDGGGSGYAKSYNYDERLRYNEPPSFVNPKSQTWVIGRETTE